MSNDKTTLADVQPGGRVRLGDGPTIEKRARELLAAQFNPEGRALFERGEAVVVTTASALNAIKAALSAQPSPGGQGELAALQQDYDKLLDSFDRQVEVAEKIAGRVLQQDDRIEELEEALAARQPVGEPLRVHVPRHEASPYFECTPDQWSQHTHGMTAAGKNMLANMLAHHLLLARRDELGWIITRDDLIAEGRPWWHVSNDGKLTYDYDPATKERKAPAPNAQAVDLARIRSTVQALLNWIDDWAETPEESGIGAIEIEAGAVLDLIDSQAVGK